MYFLKHAPEILGNNIIGNFLGIVQFGQPGSKGKIFQYKIWGIDKIPVAYGAYKDKDRVFHPVAQTGHLAEYVRVVTPRKTLVAGNRDNGGAGSMLLAGPGEKDTLYPAGAGNNIKHGFLYSRKKRLGIFQNPAALPQFGGRDEVHRLGNLQGLPYGPHPEADIPQIRHYSSYLLTCL
jgi:hypothetical protein